MELYLIYAIIKKTFIIIILIYFMTEAFHLAGTLQQLLVILYFYLDVNLRFVNKIINNRPKDCVNRVKTDVHKKEYESNPKLKCTM